MYIAMYGQQSPASVKHCQDLGNTTRTCAVNTKYTCHHHNPHMARNTDTASRHENNAAERSSGVNFGV